MDPFLYQAVTNKIQLSSKIAARTTMPSGVSLVTMKHRIVRLGAGLRIPVTLRRVPGGLLFWKSAKEDRQQAKEVAQRLQGARRKRQAHPDRPRGRR